jgi:hypothetical protein
VETGHGLDSEAPANERAGYRQAKPKPPRHISTPPLSVQGGDGKTLKSTTPAPMS